MQYTGKLITLGSFREKFVPLLLDTPSSDIETKTLANSVESLYSDLVAGDFDERTFVNQLNSLFPIAIVGSQPDCGFSKSTGSTFASISDGGLSKASSVPPQYAECV